MAAGREWFIHTIYTVRSRENANRGIGKRSLEYHAVSRHGPPAPPRPRRSAAQRPDPVEGIGTENDRGTNILHIALDRGPGARQRGGPGPREDDAAPGGGAGVAPRELNQREEEGDERLVLVIGVVVGLLLVALVAVATALLVRSRKDKSAAGREPPVSASTEPMVGGGGGGDSSEV